MTHLLITSIIAATAIAILRYRLYDIDILINRTLVYSSLTALIVAIYVIIVGSLGSLLQTGGRLPVSLFATGIVAISFQPLRERLQRGVNRLMYGERDEPYAVLGRLAQRLEVVVAAQSVLPTIVETVAEALKLPYAAIALKDGEDFTTAAEYPRTIDDSNPDTVTEALPLVYQSEAIGHLILARRSPGEQFSQMDRQLLETIARQAGIAAYNVRLTQDLQRSRERLVTTREEERRRLRRDLHDGLGPALASTSFKLDALQNMAERDPAAVRRLAQELKTQMQDALADIRRIAYDLRPPALDELGLVGALKEHIAAHNQAQGLQITLETPETLPPLPAAVEVAAYRIALEAMTNVSRHARARTCSIRFSLSGDLCLEVTDDGCGIPAAVRAGVGLSSMRERAEELGGECVIEALPGEGSRVLACLPLSLEHSTEESVWRQSES
jgi:signal transduction histidine kinase